MTSLASDMAHHLCPQRKRNKLNKFKRLKNNLLPPKQLLKYFCSAFLEPWRDLENKHGFVPVWSKMLMNASSTQGTTQCTMEVKHCNKMAHCTYYLQSLFLNWKNKKLWIHIKIMCVCIYISIDQLLLIRRLGRLLHARQMVFSILAFQPVEYDLPTNVVTVCVMENPIFCLNWAKTF